MEKTKRKINTIGKVCRVFAIIFTVLMIISASALFITGAAFVAVPNSAFTAETSGSAEVKITGSWVDLIPEEYVEKLSADLKNGTAKINLDPGAVNGVEKKDGAIVLQVSGSAADFTLRRLGFALMTLSAIPGCLIYVALELCRLMKELSVCETPFCEGVVSAMTGFAVSLIPYAIVKPAVSSLAGQLLRSNDFYFDFKLDLTVVFAVLVIVLIIMIFKYGVGLQKESDETL